MKINKAMFNPGPDVFYDKSFRDTLEAHMTFFRESPKTHAMQVEPHRATVYEGDLFGYLSERLYAPAQHWLIMRVNGFFTPHAFGLATEELLIPDTTEVEFIRQGFMATGLISM